MATVSVLYLDDAVVGPHLELLRYVCQPLSASRPHVTVRYFDKLTRTRVAHFNTTVSSIDLIEPGEFGLGDPTSGINRTVYIRCASEELEALEHKPHFPHSEFHITLYDGQALGFAKAVLRIVREFRWRFTVRLPATSTLHEIKVKNRRSNEEQSSREYNASVRQIFHLVTGKQLSWSYLMELSDHQRLTIVRAICKHLHAVTAAFEEVQTPQNGETSVLPASDMHEDCDTQLHVTPPELARDIAEYALSLVSVPGCQVSFGDPAVGTGAFYQALLQVVSPDRIASAIGVDISAKQVNVARRKWSHRGMTVIHGDYLHMESLSPRNLILANPPYLRHQDIPVNVKTEMGQRLLVSMGMQVGAQSGLYVYFLLLSHGWMEQGAVAAWLIPSEFMQTGYGSAVRSYLTHKVQLIRIHIFDPGDPQFENAMVCPAVVVFRNCHPSEGHSAVLSTNGTLQKPVIQETVDIADLRREGKWSVPSRPYRPTKSSDRHIEDLFIIRRGIATGANTFFIMERTEAEQIGIPNVALRPILPKVRALETDIVEGDKDGYPRVDPQLCVLDCSLSEEEISARYPRFSAYLATARGRGIRDLTLVQHRSPWYRQERREPAPFLCTYMGRGCHGKPPLRFIWNKSRAIAANTYMLLYPRPQLTQLLSARPGIAQDVFLLLQETARKTMSKNSRVYAGGLRKIEPSELRKVRLASHPSWLDQAIDRQPLLV